MNKEDLRIGMHVKIADNPFRALREYAGKVMEICELSYGNSIVKFTEDEKKIAWPYDIIANVVDVEMDYMQESAAEVDGFLLGFCGEM